MSLELTKKALKNGKEVIEMMASKKTFRDNFAKSLRSNMTTSQINKGMKELLPASSYERVTKLANNAIRGVKRKGLSAAEQKKIVSKIYSNAIMKNDIKGKLADSIGGGITSSYRTLKNTRSVKKALQSGFTKKVNGQRQLRLDRVAGATFGASVAGRVITGGGLYRDRYGRINVPGVPFI